MPAQCGDEGEDEGGDARWEAMYEFPKRVPLYMLACCFSTIRVCVCV